MTQGISNQCKLNVKLGGKNWFVDLSCQLKSLLQAEKKQMRTCYIFKNAKLFEQKHQTEDCKIVRGSTLWQKATAHGYN